VSSTQRNDTSRGVFLARIAIAWDERPDLTFAQLLTQALNSAQIEHLGMLDNHEIITALQHFTAKKE
jgi:hypothetical protein